MVADPGAAEREACTWRLPPPSTILCRCSMCSCCSRTGHCQCHLPRLNQTINQLTIGFTWCFWSKRGTLVFFFPLPALKYSFTKSTHSSTPVLTTNELLEVTEYTIYSEYIPFMLLCRQSSKATEYSHF